MNRIINWFKESNRWKHVVGGMMIGLFSRDWYSASLAGITTSSALEFKDKAWGGGWDWIDWGLTIAGSILGFGIRCIVL